MHPDEESRKIAKKYRRFAEYEARGVSPLYEAIAHTVATDPGVISFLRTLPPAKQQPNLLFAAFRTICGTPADATEFCQILLEHQEHIRAVMLSRATQTNEAARCAILLPVLSQLPQPLALLEVGASAGLCLFPDKYGYRYGNRVLHPEGGVKDVPEFLCDSSGNTPLPTRLPEVVWRAGIDLNPIDVADPDALGWLEQLIWPEHITRLQNFRRAVSVARQDPPLLVAGDLLEHLVPLAQQAPPDTTLVVFHSAVLAYIADRSMREQFVTAVTDLDATWISNEHPMVFPEFAANLPFDPPANQFLLAVDGNPVATTGPHGQSINWIA